MAAATSNLVDVGRITSVFGVKGWVKIHSYTEPEDGLFGYAPWWLKTPHGVKPLAIDEFRPHGKGFVAHIEGVDDREQAALLTAQMIAVDRSQLPALAEGDYYWHQLVGLAVVSVYEDRRVHLGRVAKLMETGANDVLVVAADAESIDDRERLVPYVPEQFVLRVDLEAGCIEVDWDPDF